MRESTIGQLARISRSLPRKIPKYRSEIIRLLKEITRNLTGMASSCAIPVRTRFLHFAYPEVVPILDKQVLKAVGVEDKGANQSYDVLRDYIRHAWLLADRYRSHLAMFEQETLSG